MRNQFTEEEKRIIHEGLAAGVSAIKIAKSINRLPPAIHSYAHRNGLIKSKLIENGNKETKEKIKNIEFQIEILFDLIKEFKDGKDN